MVVQSIDEQAKMVATTWFSDHHECQEGDFPGSALDRVEVPKASKQKKAAVAQKPAALKAAAGRGKK